jgi:hypothetical protein
MAGNAKLLKKFNITYPAELDSIVETIVLAAGAGYAEGAAAGAVLGALTGLPPATQNALARGGALLNLVRTAVPVLLGAD